MGNPARLCCLGVKREAPVAPGDTQQSHEEGGSFAGGVASPPSAWRFTRCGALISRCTNIVPVCTGVQATRVVSNAGIGCIEKPEGHLLNAVISKEKAGNPINCEYGGGGGAGVAMAEHASGVGGGGRRRRRRGGGLKGGAIALLLIFSPPSNVSASRSPPSPMVLTPPSYSPQSQIFPPETHFPPPPSPPVSPPTSPLSENNTDDPTAEMGPPPRPASGTCLPWC